MNNGTAVPDIFDLLARCVPFGYLLLGLGTVGDVFGINGVTTEAWALTYWLCLAVSYVVMGWSWHLTFRVLRSSNGNRRLVNRALVGFAAANGLLGIGFIGYQKDLDQQGGLHWLVPYAGWAIGYLVIAIGFSAFVVGGRRPSVTARTGENRPQQPPAAAVGARASRAVILAGFGLVALGTAIIGGNLIPGWLHFPRGVAVYFAASTLAMCVTGWAWWTYARAASADPILLDRLRRPVRVYALATLVVAIAYFVPPVAPGTPFVAFGYFLVTIGLWTAWSKAKEPILGVVHEAV